MRKSKASRDAASEEEIEIQPDRFERRRQKKEAADIAMALVERICTLKSNEVENLPIEDDVLRDEVMHLTAMKSDGARKRQCRYVSSLFTPDVIDVLTEFLAAKDSRHSSNVEQEHLLERWRDYLIAQGDAALDYIIEVSPELDRQAARQLILKARREQKEAESKENPSKVAYRALHRWLKNFKDVLPEIPEKSPSKKKTLAPETVREHDEFEGY